MKCFDNKNKKKKSKWEIIGFELKANDKDLYAVVRVSKASLLMFLIDGYRMLLKKRAKFYFYPGRTIELNRLFSIGANFPSLKNTWTAS